MIGGEGNLLGLGVIGGADVSDIAVVRQVAHHDVLSFGDLSGEGNGDFHIAAQLVQLRVGASVRVGDDQRYLHNDGFLCDAVQRLLLEVGQVFFLHSGELYGHSVLVTGNGGRHGVQHRAAHGDGGVLGGDGQAAGLVALAEGLQQTAGQDQLVHAFHAAEVHGHVAFGVVHNVGQFVLGHSDLSLAAIHSDGNAGAVHLDALLDGQRAGGEGTVGLDVVAGG